MTNPQAYGLLGGDNTENGAAGLLAPGLQLQVYDVWTPVQTANGVMQLRIAGLQLQSYDDTPATHMGELIQQSLLSWTFIKSRKMVQRT